MPPKTSAWEHYERVQAFKDDPRSMIDGVNYAQVIALYLYNRSFRHWLKILAFSFLYRSRTELTGTGRGVLSFYSYRYKKRSDYDYIAGYLSKTLGEEADSVEVRESLSALQWFRTLGSLPNAWRASAGYPGGIMDRVSVAVLIAKYLVVAERSMQTLIHGRAQLVTFCDAAPHDNLVAQMAKLRGVFTVTVQHGQYRVLESNNMSIDAEAYANFVSDRMLCWGEATRAEFLRFGTHPTRLFITGWIRTWDSIVRPVEEMGTFGVMLNGANGEVSNLELLKAASSLADQLNLNYLVRLHPSFSPTHYQRLVSERCLAIRAIPASEYIPKVDFSLAHMSGATIEMLQVDSPVYVLDDGLLASAFRLPGLSFSDVNTLVATIRSDMNQSDRGIGRTRQLRLWFNDDSDQDARVIAAIRLGDAKCTG